MSLTLDETQTVIIGSTIFHVTFCMVINSNLLNNTKLKAFLLTTLKDSGNFKNKFHSKALLIWNLKTLRNYASA